MLSILVSVLNCYVLHSLIIYNLISIKFFNKKRIWASYTQMYIPVHPIGTQNTLTSKIAHKPNLDHV